MLSGNPTVNMMPQKPLEFHNLGEAVLYFYKSFSVSAPERFERYLSASGGRHLDAIVRYRWNLELGEALLPSLHAAELTLRNAIHQAMVKQYLPTVRPHFPGGEHPDDWWFDAEFEGKPFLKYEDKIKVDDVVRQLEKAGKRVTTARVVAELSFAFWVELLNSGYTEPIVVPALKTTLRGLPDEKKRQGWLRDNFGKLRDLRNRISHHEPIFERHDLDQLRRLAWLTSAEIQRYFVYPLHPMCRFVEVAGTDLKDETNKLKARIDRDFFQPNRKPDPNESVNTAL